MAGDDTQAGRDHLLQDILPMWAKLVILVLFIIVLVPIGILTALFGPKANDTLVDNHPVVDPADFFSGKEPLVASSQDLAFGGLRHRLWIALTLQNRLAQQTSLVKEDALFAIRIYDKDNVTWADTTITRPLVCPQKSVAPDEPGCEPILLAHFPIVSAASPIPLTTEIRALNLGPIADSGLLENFTSVEWEYSSEFHTIIHIIFHYALFIISLALLVGFLIAHAIHLWKMRTTAPRLTVFNFEPIWIIGLLLFLALYNNPLYIGSFVFGSKSFIFEILNSAFALLFAHSFLLFLLLMLHASMRNSSSHPLNSKEFWLNELIFSGPKIFFVVASFIPRLLFFLYFRFLQLQDPTFVGHHNVLLNILRIWGDCAFLMILVSGCYWAVRSFVNAPKLLKEDDGSRGYNAGRFFLFFKFVFILFLAFCVDFIVLIIADSPFIRSFGPELFHAVNFDASINGFSFWALNIWVVFLTFLHLPANVFGSTIARLLLAINDKDPLIRVPYIRGLIVTTEASAYSDEAPFFSAQARQGAMFGGTVAESAPANRDQPVFSPSSASPDGYKIHYDDDDAADAGHSDQTNVVAQTEEEPSQVSYNYGGTTSTGFGTANTTLDASSAFATNATDPNQSWGRYSPPAATQEGYSSF